MIDFLKQIEDIEKEIRETPYHKGTEHHIGKLRARISRLKEKLFETSIRKSGGGAGYAVKKQGDATLILIGPPSSGKSTLINALTNAQSKVAPYEFTTVSVIPGMMYYKDAKIQILDVPGLIEGAEEGKGRGKEVLSVARGSDLIVLMTDIDRIKAIKRIEEALEKNGIRLNIVRPNVIINKKIGGGIIIHSNIKQDYSKETIKEIVLELGIKNAEIYIKEKLSMDRLIDAFSKNRVYIPTISIVNKADLKNTITGAISFHPRGGNKATPLTPLYISAIKETGLEQLKENIWKILNFVRIYLVRTDEEPSYNNPIISKKGMKLSDIAKEIGSDFSENKSRAIIWGSGAKFPGQEVSLSTEIKEGMQIRFI